MEEKHMTLANVAIEDKDKTTYYTREYVDDLKYQIELLKQERAKSLYLVWNPAGNNPQKRYWNVDEARKEARRLAEENQGAEFFVLRAVESVKYRTDPFECRSYCKR